MPTQPALALVGLLVSIFGAATPLRAAEAHEPGGPVVVIQPGPSKATWKVYCNSYGEVTPLATTSIARRWLNAAGGTAMWLYPKGDAPREAIAVLDMIVADGPDRTRRLRVELRAANLVPRWTLDDRLVPTSKNQKLQAWPKEMLGEIRSLKVNGTDRERVEEVDRIEIEHNKVLRSDTCN